MSRDRLTSASFLSVNPPAERLARMREALAEERAATRAGDPGSWDRRVAEKNVEDLEAAIARTEHNEALHAERIAQLEADERAKTAARQEEEQAALEADLRRKYDLAAPKPTSDEEWNLIRESVLHRYRLQAMDQLDAQVAEARRRYARFV